MCIRRIIRCSSSSTNDFFLAINVFKRVSHTTCTALALRSFQARSSRCLVLYKNIKRMEGLSENIIKEYI